MVGAPALAANAAYRSGSGLVRIAADASIITALLTLCPSATAVAYSPSAPTALWSALGTHDVVAIGPGWGQQPGLTGILRGILSQFPGPVVCDADALNLLALAGPQCKTWRTDWRNVILTPHPGEYQRLARGLGLASLTQRADQARALAEFLGGATVILKGYHTICTDGTTSHTNQTGNTAMATAGMGDVLTGVVASLLGQGLPPLAAATRAAHSHGRAGDLALAQLGGNIGLMAADVIAQLPRAISESIGT
jgi:NAD(P)H-hydrate epimerase